MARRPLDRRTVLKGLLGGAVVSVALLVRSLVRNLEIVKEQSLVQE